MKYNLTLVKLTQDQARQAKEANGNRKRITHALICGPYGRRFGTEKQCHKYFRAWDPEHVLEEAPGRFKPIFPRLFDKAARTDQFEIIDYKSTWDLTGKLFEASESEPYSRKVRGERDHQLESNA